MNRVLSPVEQVRIARTRERVTALRDEHPEAVISVRVPGTDLFVAAAGPTHLDHLLCDLEGNVIANIPGRESERLPAVALHLLFHRSAGNEGELIRHRPLRATA